MSDQATIHVLTVITFVELSVIVGFLYYVSMARNLGDDYAAGFDAGRDVANTDAEGRLTEIIDIAKEKRREIRAELNDDEEEDGE